MMVLAIPAYLAMWIAAIFLKTPRFTMSVPYTRSCSSWRLDLASWRSWTIHSHSFDRLVLDVGEFAVSLRGGSAEPLMGSFSRAQIDRPAVVNFRLSAARSSPSYVMQQRNDGLLLHHRGCCGLAWRRHGRVPRACRRNRAAPVAPGAPRRSQAPSRELRRPRFTCTGAISRPSRPIGHGGNPARLSAVRRLDDVTQTIHKLSHDSTRRVFLRPGPASTGSSKASRRDWRSHPSAPGTDRADRQ
jgi:hypothetical protein